jgi:hypothetical protein
MIEGKKNLRRLQRRERERHSPQAGTGTLPP